MLASIADSKRGQPGFSLGRLGVNLGSGCSQPGVITGSTWGQHWVQLRINIGSTRSQPGKAWVNWGSTGGQPATPHLTLYTHKYDPVSAQSSPYIRRNLTLYMYTPVVNMGSTCAAPPSLARARRLWPHPPTPLGCRSPESPPLVRRRCTCWRPPRRVFLTLVHFSAQPEPVWSVSRFVSS